MTNSDKHNLKYFWQQKRDITRWDEWLEKKENIRKAFPALVAAVDSISVAEQTLDALMASMSMEEEE